MRGLPVLAPHLPLPIPEPLALGRPGEGYPFPWSVRRWIEGEPARRERIADLPEFARDLAWFLTVLHAIDAGAGPPAGTHNFHRGGDLSVYDAETRAAAAALADELDPAPALALWEAAPATSWDRPPVWVHGDMAAGNLLVRDGRLAAVIDFGNLGTGDPACDLAIAWTLFDAEARAAFRAALQLDPATWLRGRAWTLWKALITVADKRTTAPAEADTARRTLREVIADHQSEGRHVQQRPSP